MARVLRIADSTQTDTIDLIAGTLALEEQSWVTSGPGPGFELITETMGLVANADDLVIDDAAAELDERLEKIRLWHADPQYPTSYWLEANTADEQPRRSLLYSGVTGISTGVGWSPFFEQDAGQLSLSLTRHPLWESTTGSSASTAALAAIGTAASLPTVAGTKDARLYQVDIYGNTGGATPLTEFWLGIRPDYTSSADFVPVWEAELGAAASADTTGQNIAGDSGTSMQCDFSSTEAMDDRVCIVIDDVTATSNYHHFRGRYMVLGRVQVGAASTTVGIQLKPGYYIAASDPSYTTCEPVYITNTAWRLVPLGEVSIPPEGGWTGQSTTHLGRFGFQIAAERVAGAGTFDLDYLCLIPSQHMLWVSGAYIVNNANPHTYEVQALTHENDEQDVIAWQNSGVKGGVEFTFRNWTLPIGNNKVVIAGQRGSTHDLTDTMTVYLYYYTRWRTYRGTGTT